MGQPQEGPDSISNLKYSAIISGLSNLRSAKKKPDEQKHRSLVNNRKFLFIDEDKNRIFIGSVFYDRCESTSLCQNFQFPTEIQTQNIIN